jgi:hypothetical protein
VPGPSGFSLDSPGTTALTQTTAKLLIGLRSHSAVTSVLASTAGSGGSAPLDAIGEHVEDPLPRR